MPAPEHGLSCRETVNLNLLSHLTMVKIIQTVQARNVHIKRVSARRGCHAHP